MKTTKNSFRDRRRNSIDWTQWWNLTVLILPVLKTSFVRRFLFTGSRTIKYETEKVAIAYLIFKVERNNICNNFCWYLKFWGIPFLWLPQRHFWGQGWCFKVRPQKLLPEPNVLVQIPPKLQMKSLGPNQVLFWCTGLPRNRRLLRTSYETPFKPQFRFPTKGTHVSEYRGNCMQFCYGAFGK